MPRTIAASSRAQPRATYGATNRPAAPIAAATHTVPPDTVNRPKWAARSPIIGTSTGRARSTREPAHAVTTSDAPTTPVGKSSSS
jgi:hypothetical protein